MKKIALAMSLIAAVTTNVYAEDKKFISESLTMNEGQNLEIDFPVGSLEVIVVDGNELSIDIEVKGKDDGWFSKSKDVSHVELEKHVRDNRISLEIDEDNLNQEWVIKVPKFAAIDIDLGVGSIEIEQLENSLEAEVGVGSIRIDTQLNDFKQVELSSGVGDTSMKGFESGSKSVRNMVSSEVNYRGDGQHIIDAEVGVGDIKLRK